MRNLKKVLCLALVLSMVLAVVSGAAYVRTYNDAADMTLINEEYTFAAQLLNDLGIVIGAPGEKSGTYDYQPTAELTRAELARILYVLDSQFEEGSLFDNGEAFDDIECTFTDIDYTWAKGEIKYGWLQGYLSGRNAQTYDPEAKVTVREMATALLAVLGIDKAELAKNWPNNVIKYGYKKGANLFTTGLSTNPSDVNVTGYHIAGYMVSGQVEPETEGELKLSENITREQAFYMLYKAIYKYPVDGSTYLKKYWNYTEEKGTVTGTVVSGATKSLIAAATGKAGYLTIDVNGANKKFVDIGTSYTKHAVSNASQGAAIGQGFDIGAKDWDAFIGMTITAKTVKFFKNGVQVGSDYIYGYDFDFDKMQPTGLTGTAIAVSDVKVKAGAAVSFDATANTVTVGGETYECAKIVYGSSNGASAQYKDAAAVAAAIGNGADEKASEELTLTVGNNGVLYSFVEVSYTVLKVTAVNTSALTLTVVDPYDDTVSGVVSYVAKEYLGADNKTKVNPAKGDYLYGVVSKGNKFKGHVIAVSEKTEVTISGGKTLVGGSEVKAGSYKALNAAANAEYVSATAITDTADKYFDLVYAGNVYYVATEIEKYDDATASVVGNTRAVSTADNKAHFTITLKDAAGTSYTYSAAFETGSSDDTALSALKKDDVVSITFDVKSNAVKTLKVDN